MGGCQSLEACKSIEATKYAIPVKTTKKQQKKFLVVRVSRESNKKQEQLPSPSEFTSPVTPSTVGISPRNFLQALPEDVSYDDDDAYNLEDTSSLVETSGKTSKSSIPQTEEGPNLNNEKGIPQNVLQPQDHVKLMNQRVTNPMSIIHNTTNQPEEITSGGIAAVTSQTLANFHKLKVQVELANRAEKHRKHQEKFAHRLVEAQESKLLWDEYQEIQQQVHQTTSPESPPAESLQDTKTWHFDFNDLPAPQDELPPNQVLLSQATLEAQKRFFKQKSRDRKHNKRRYQDHQDHRSVVSAPPYSYQDDYGPVRLDVESAYCSDDETPKRRTPTKVLPDDDISAYTLDWEMNNDYGVQRRRPRRRHQDVDEEELQMEKILPVVDFSFPTAEGKQDYGFDPNVPLSTQLNHLMATTTTSAVKSSDITSVMHQPLFDGKSTKLDGTNRRLEFAASEDDKENKLPQINPSNLSGIPHKHSKPGPNNTLSTDKPFINKTSKRISSTATRTKPAPKNTPTAASQNPFLEMSTEQFLMMSSPPLTSLQEQSIDISSNPFYDMSPEQFLMMSTFNVNAATLEGSVEADDDYTDDFLLSSLPEEVDTVPGEKSIISYDETIVSTPKASPNKDNFLLGETPSTVNHDPEDSPEKEDEEEDDVFAWQNHMSDNDFWDIERTRFSIDKCDELATRVSLEMNHLLNKYKQDNSSVGQHTV